MFDPSSPRAFRLIDRPGAQRNMFFTLRRFGSDNDARATAASHTGSAPQLRTGCCPMAFLHTVFVLSVAFVLGTAIGFERQWRQHSAGLRTVVLVAVGAAAFADLGFQLNGKAGVASIVAYVVSGIGFLGAGVILKDGASIRGLNTAATIWSSAAVGAFSGAGMPLRRPVVAAFILAGNTLLRPLVDSINRRPITGAETEAQYSVHATCLPRCQRRPRPAGRDAGRAQISDPDVTTVSQGAEQVELIAELLPTSAEDVELDRAVADLLRSPLVRSATWAVDVDL